MHQSTEMQYLVLADRAVPYLLARVRWPDVAQAISAGSPDWLDDIGLFDLPYDPGSIAVSFEQAASVAAEWGTQLHTEPTDGAPSYIRRMPAKWSDPSPAERRAWGIEAVGRLRPPARRIRPPAVSGLPDSATERRDDVRVTLAGHAHLRHDEATLSVGLVDVSRGGARCVMSTALSSIVAGAQFAGPLLLETDASGSHLCFDVTSRITWCRGTKGGTQFGVAFGKLAEPEIDGLRRALAAGSRK